MHTYIWFLLVTLEVMLRQTINIYGYCHALFLQWELCWDVLFKQSFGVFPFMINCSAVYVGQGKQDQDPLDLEQVIRDSPLFLGEHMPQSWPRPQAGPWAMVHKLVCAAQRWLSDFLSHKTALTPLNFLTNVQPHHLACHCRFERLSIVPWSSYRPVGLALLKTICKSLLKKKRACQKRIVGSMILLGILGLLLGFHVF